MPDFFVVLETERKPRKSWVVWEEDGKYPHVIVEIISPKTAATDRGLKKQIYQDIFRTPDYFWFDPDSLELKGFQLVGGRYQELQPNTDGWLWSQQLELYLGTHQSKLRLFTPEGQLIPTPEEAAQQERQRAQQAESELEQERQRVERLAEKLREFGIDPLELYITLSCISAIALFHPFAFVGQMVGTAHYPFKPEPSCSAIWKALTTVAYRRSQSSTLSW